MSEGRWGSAWEREAETKPAEPEPVIERAEQPKKKKKRRQPAEAGEAKRGRPAGTGSLARDRRIAALLLPLTDSASKTVMRENAAEVVKMLVEAHGYAVFSEGGSDG